MPPISAQFIFIEASQWPEVARSRSLPTLRPSSNFGRLSKSAAAIRPAQPVPEQLFNLSQAIRRLAQLRSLLHSLLLATPPTPPMVVPVLAASAQYRREVASRPSRLRKPKARPLPLPNGKLIIHQSLSAIPEQPRLGSGSL